MLDIDMIYHRLRYAVNTLVAVHAAMAETSNDPGSFVDAVYVVADYMAMLLDEMGEILGYEHG